MNRQLTGTTSLITLARTADRESQDKNLVGSLDRFAKTIRPIRFLPMYMYTPITVFNLISLQYNRCFA